MKNTITICFIGHKEIDNILEVEKKLKACIDMCFEKYNVEKFLFGSRSVFNTLSKKVIDEYKKINPNIIRVYVRAEFPYISQDYEDFLLEHYEQTYFPESIINAGRNVYVERNQILIDSSDICIFYYNPEYLPKTKKSKNDILPRQRKSGTELAYQYALKKKKIVINIF